LKQLSRCPYLLDATLSGLASCTFAIWCRVYKSCEDRSRDFSAP